MAKGSTEEGPQPPKGYFTSKNEQESFLKNYNRERNPNDTQPTRAVKNETPEREPTPEPEPKSTTKTNIVANIFWFFFFVGLLWLSDVAGEAFPTPLDDIIYDTAIAILYGTLASFGVFTKRK